MSDLLADAFAIDPSNDAAWSNLQSMFESAFLLRGIPGYMVGGLARFVVFGIEPGDFLFAVLSNDLKEAAGKADDVNRGLLFQYADCMYNDLPSCAQGSVRAVRGWARIGGLRKFCGFNQHERFEHYDEYCNEKER